MTDEQSPKPPDPTAPKNLDKAFAFLKANLEPRIEKARRVAVARKQAHRHFCRICGVTHNDRPQLAVKAEKPIVLGTPVAEGAITERTCRACQQQLDEGLTAIVCDESPRRYAWVTLAGSERQVLEVSPAVMDKVELQFKKSDQAEPGANGEQE